jgi:hypothetical protein
MRKRSSPNKHPTKFNYENKNIKMHNLRFFLGRVRREKGVIIGMKA